MYGEDDVKQETPVEEVKLPEESEAQPPVEEVKPVEPAILE